MPPGFSGDAKRTERIIEPLNRLSAESRSVHEVTPDRRGLQWRMEAGLSAALVLASGAAESSASFVRVMPVRRDGRLRAAKRRPHRSPPASPRPHVSLPTNPYVRFLAYGTERKVLWDVVDVADEQGGLAALRHDRL